VISVTQAFLRIPASRIAVLIGPSGKTKKKIEKATSSRVSIDSKTGEITIESRDAEKQNRAESIVKAIGRGFSPGKALLLAKGDYTLSVLNLRELLGKSERTIKQKKARVIGRNGNIRNRIEKETGSHVSVYGNTVSLIGLFEEVENAELVVKAILEGANISTAFEMLREKLAREKRFEL